MKCRLAVAVFAWVALVCSTAQAAPDFVKDVRPIFERSCYGCHGPEKQKNGYRLDARDIAIKGGESGESAIVPHNANKSLLIRYVTGEDEAMLMPPQKSDKPRLTAAEVETLRAWINAGPSWPDEFAGGVKDAKPHWSLTPLVKPAIPSKGGNPIDSFIAAKLQREDMLTLVPKLMEEAERKAGPDSDNLSVIGLTWERQEEEEPVSPNVTVTGPMEGFTTSSMNSSQKSSPFKDDISDEEIQKAILEIQEAIKKAPK